MNKKILYNYRLYFTGMITIAIWSLLIWSHYNGDVQSHHLLQRKELPEISNWWNGLIIPLVTWFLLYRTKKRIVTNSYNNSKELKVPASIINGFIVALIYGALIAVLFTYDVASIPGYLLLGILLIAFFYPVYRAECILGLVLGMTVTFGAFIPTLLAVIFSILGFLINRFIRPAISCIVFKTLRRITPNK